MEGTFLAFDTTCSDNEMWVQIISGAYVLITILYSQFRYEELDLQIPTILHYEYMEKLIFWYSLAFVVVTKVPYIILFSIGTPPDAYPDTKDGLILKLSGIFSIGITLHTVIGPAFYLYNCLELGFMTIVEIIVCGTYSFALFQSSKIWLYLLIFNCYTILDTIKIWMFMLRQSRKNRNISNV